MLVSANCSRARSTFTRSHPDPRVRKLSLDHPALFSAEGGRGPRARDRHAPPGHATEVEEVHAEVGQERERAGQLEAAERADRAPAADDRERALVEVAERRRSRPARPQRSPAPRDAPAGSPPSRGRAAACLRTRGGPRRRRSRRSRDVRPASSPGATSSRPPRSCAAPVASASVRANGAACTPAAQITVVASIALRLAALLERDAVGVDRGGTRALEHVDAQLAQLVAGLGRQLRAERGQHPIAGIEHNDARVAAGSKRVNWPLAGGGGRARRAGPAISIAGRPAADHHERLAAAAARPRSLRRRSASSKRRQDVVAQRRPRPPAS